MTIVVAEQSIAAAGARNASPRLVVVPRARRRGRWRPLDPDAVTAALSALAEDAVVAARPAAADRGAAALPPLAAIMGVPCVRLPADAAAATATVAIVARPGFEASVRAVEVVAVLAGEGTALPALRPAVLARWTGRVWRPCAACAGGGPAGVRCGRCGARIPREPA